MPENPEQDFDRLKEISDLIGSLELTAIYYPENQRIIQNLREERKVILSKYFKSV